jgi:prepilin-type N-terminal cleavage/methylation domain-containing protein
MEKNKGFSLVELIIVIAVMAILTGIIAPQFLGYTDEAKRNVAIRNCRTVVKTTEVYIAETENVLLEAPFDIIKENSNVKGKFRVFKSIRKVQSHILDTRNFILLFKKTMNMLF